MLQSTPPSPDRKAEPFYLDGPHGKLFAIYHPPQNNIQVKGCFLYIQPLAEEMNRCRQMVAIQAREFSKLGYGCLLLDLYGTGDSEGEYQDGNWDIYLADLNAGLRWISAQGYDHARLWALRHGAFLALDLARAVPALRKVLLWQPVLNGKAAVTQILRIALAGALSEQDKISMSQLRSRIQEDAVVELSGYETSASLLSVLETKHVSNYYELTDLEVQWFDVLASLEQNRSKESIQVEKNWNEAGVQIHYEAVIGPAFWQVWERVVADRLIERTSAWAQKN
ncbi:MAG: hydrolase 2, exosortase A system-associated [Nitrosomonas sp.]|nr:hydrolase 2, exosortase A system-associated [Nitrosomonas sp.]